MIGLLKSYTETKLEPQTVNKVNFKQGQEFAWGSKHGLGNYIVNNEGYIKHKFNKNKVIITIIII